MLPYNDPALIHLVDGPDPTWGGSWWFDDAKLRVAYGNGCSIELPQVGIEISGGDKSDLFQAVSDAGKNRRKLQNVFWKFVFGYFQKKPKEFIDYLEAYWRANADNALTTFMENGFEIGK